LLNSWCAAKTLQLESVTLIHHGSFFFFTHNGANLHFQDVYADYYDYLAAEASEATVAPCPVEDCRLERERVRKKRTSSIAIIR
jgi:hypothetical protein